MAETPGAEGADTDGHNETEVIAGDDDDISGSGDGVAAGEEVDSRVDDEVDSRVDGRVSDP